MNVRILGSLEVRGRGGELALGGTKQRAVFAMLALQCNHVVSVVHRINGLWAADRPETAGNAAHIMSSRDPNQWVQAIAEVCRPQRREALISRGRARASQMTWSVCADRLLQAMAELQAR